MNVSECLGLQHCDTQQRATVIFERSEDQDSCLITVAAAGMIRQFVGHNEFNPSLRRRATCVYLEDEWWGCGLAGELNRQHRIQNKGVPSHSITGITKVCIYQHKGATLFDVRLVEQPELIYLFGEKNKGDVNNFFEKYRNDSFEDDWSCQSQWWFGNHPFES